MTDKQRNNEDVKLNSTRLENENKFINALLYGVLVKQAKLEDGFSVCPLQLLQKGTDAYKLGHIMQELHKAVIEITTDTMADKMRQLYPDFDIAKIGEVFSAYGNEEAIKHLAKLAHREAIKRLAEPEIYNILKECKTYGDNLDTIEKGLVHVRNSFENISIEKAYVGTIFNTIGSRLVSLFLKEDFN